MTPTRAERGRSPDSTPREPRVRRASPITEPPGLDVDAARAGRSREQILAVQRTAGNAAAQRLFGSPPPAAPVVQRLWTQETFAKQTYEGLLTRRGAAQKTIDSLLEAYYALTAKGEPRGAAELTLLDQMQRSAEFWIADHTVTLDGQTEEDPGRKKRMAGMREFIVNVTAELTAVKAEMTLRGQDPAAIPIGEEHEKFRKLREKYEGSANSVFTRIGGLVDGAVPNKGDSAELDIEVTIPVDPGGGFVGGHLKMEIEHGDEDLLKARTELTVTGGIDINVAKFKAEAGGYVEAQAATGKDVMNLYSYGLYRRFRESNVIPREFTNYMWGGRSGSFGKKKSELWSRELEMQLFKAIPTPVRTDPQYASLPQAEGDKQFAADLAESERSRARVKETYVETGGILGGTVEVSIADLVDLKLTGGYSTGRRITAESISKVKEVGGKNVGPLTRGGQKQLGESTSTRKLGAEISSGPVSGTVEVSWSGAEREVEIEGGFAMPASTLAGNGAGVAIALFVASAVKVVRYAATELGKQEAAETGRKAGRAVDSAADLTTALTQLTKAPKETFKPKFEAAKDELAVESTIGLTAAITVTSKRSGAAGFQATGGSFELSYARKQSLNVPKALAVSLETKSRLLRVEKDAGGWSVK